jgi:hypothetical protein
MQIPASTVVGYYPLFVSCNGGAKYISLAPSTPDSWYPDPYPCHLKSLGTPSEPVSIDRQVYCNVDHGDVRRELAMLQVMEQVPSDGLSRENATADDSLDREAKRTDDPTACVSSSALSSAPISTRRRGGRRVSKIKLARTESRIPMLESPNVENLVLTEKMKDEICQQLESGGDVRQLALSKIHGAVLRMALEPFGCRVVQLAFDVATTSEKQSFVAELRGHVRDAISSPHANFVIQKAIEVMPIASVSFVAEEMLPFAADAVRHRFACRVICRLVEHHLCSTIDSASTSALIDEVLVEAEDLIHHTYARHVIEFLLEHGSGEHRHMIASVIRRHPLCNAKCRFASYVMERAMMHCSVPDQEALVSDLVGDADCFVELASHACGVHVVKAMLKSHGTSAKLIRGLLLRRFEEIEQTRYGQRLLKEIEL